MASLQQLHLIHSQPSIWVKIKSFSSSSFPVSMRPSREPLLFGSSMAWARSCHMSSPGISWKPYVLLCCPCSRCCSEKSPQCGQGPDTMRLPSVCRGHLPLALPDQEARNRHCWAPQLAISFLSDLAALPSPGRAQCTLTEGSRPSLSPRPFIIETLYPFCASVQFWKPFNHVPVLQTSAQACYHTKISSSACVGFLISVKTHKKPP